MKLNLGRDSEARLVKILNFKFIGDADVAVKLMPSRDSEHEFDQDLCLNLSYDLKKLLW